MPATLEREIERKPLPQTGRDEMDKKKTRQVRVDEDVYDLAVKLAAHQSPPKSVPDLLTEILRPILKRDLAKAMEKTRKNLGEGE
jgi:hypothetical protein